MVNACPPRAPVRPAIVLAGLAVGVVGLIIGLGSSQVLAHIAWLRTYELATWIAGLATLSVLGAVVSQRSPRLILLVCAALMVPLLHGLAATAAVVSIGMTAASIGDRVGVDGRQRPALACVVGLALIAAAAGWTQGLPIHRPWLLVIAMFATLWVLRRNLRSVASGWIGAWHAVNQPASTSFWPLLLAALALLATGHSTLQFDDLAYHAALPAQLLSLGVNRLDAHGQIWALAPWAADVLQGWAAVLAGGEARGALNSLWWLLLVQGTLELTRSIGGGRISANWATALAASLPLSWCLLAGMQTELAGAVVMIALLGWLSRAEPSDVAAQGRVLGLLLGLLIALKLTNLAFVGGLCLAALLWAPRASWSLLPKALPWAIVAGGSSYSYAWWIRGNPVLPLFNSWFGSDYVAAADLSDLRYRQGLDPGDYYSAIFDSSVVLEGWDGTAGFQWLVLAIALLLGLVALWRQRERAESMQTLLPVRYAIVAVLFAGLALYWQMQYLRYLYPVMLVAGLAMGVGAERSELQQHSRWPLRAVLPVCLTLCVAFNLAAVGSVHWQLRDGLTPRVLLAPDAEQRWRDFAAPELRLVQIARQLDQRANILLTDSSHPYIASGLGRTFTTAWYDPELQAMERRCRADRSGQCWRTAIGQYGFGYLIGRPNERAPALAAALSDWATPVAVNGPAELLAVPVDSPQVGDIYIERKQ